MADVVRTVALSQLASVIVTWLAPVEVAVTVLVDEL
jgi:hypothetical protein